MALATNLLAQSYDLAGLSTTGNNAYQTENGNTIKIVNPGDEPSGDALYQNLELLLSETETWNNISIKEYRLKWTGSGYELLVVPSSLKVGGKSADKNVPAGIRLIKDGSLYYRFNMLVEDHFLKFDGFYQSQGILWQRMDLAIDNPGEYVKRYDPEYFLEQLTAQRVTLDETRNELNMTRNALMAFRNAQFLQGAALEPVAEGLADKVIEYRKENPDANAAKIAEVLSADGQEVEEKQVQLILAVYYNIYPE